MRALLKKQLKQLPQEQQEKVMEAFEKDPEFFKKLAEDIQKEIKKGSDQQTATMTVMMKNSEKLKELMS